MSKLLAQCAELRAMAESVGMSMPQAATLMMEAADTIWELRCKCADLMSEREEYVWTREFMGRMAKHCGTKDCPSLVSYVEGLEDENAKLRNEVDNLLDFEHLTSVAVAYAGCDECGEYKQTMLRLFAENAKLRELVADMWRFTGAACKKYPKLFDPAAQGGQMVQLNAIDAFEQRMRELRIEVGR